MVSGVWHADAASAGCMVVRMSLSLGAALEAQPRHQGKGRLRHLSPSTMTLYSSWLAALNKLKYFTGCRQQLHTFTQGCRTQGPAAVHYIL